MSAPEPMSEGVVAPVHDGKARTARGYSWETARPGNFLALRHGAYSQRIVGPLAEQLVEALLAEAPDLAAPRYRFAVSAWARAEAIACILTFWLDVTDVVDEDGQPRERAMRELRSAEARAERARGTLGLDPTSHVRLVRERAEAALSSFDVDAAVAKGREVIEVRSARGVGDG